MRTSFISRSLVLASFVALALTANSAPSEARGPGGPGGAAGAGGSSSGGSGTHRTTNPTNDPDPAGTAVKTASQAAEQAIALCDVKTPRCIADALDEYATALRQLAPLLPPELRNLPVIVEKAATKVRIARTRNEAIVAVKNAIAEVHKTIALLQADDPISNKSETRSSALVAETLQVANDKLEKAIGL
jgi:delta 1-pyrroline-5-carboxylate dehydrogenase